MLFRSVGEVVWAVRTYRAAQTARATFLLAKALGDLGVGFSDIYINNSDVLTEEQLQKWNTFVLLYSVGSFGTSAIDGVVQKFGTNSVINSQDDFKRFEKALDDSGIDVDKTLENLSDAKVKAQIEEVVGVAKGGNTLVSKLTGSLKATYDDLIKAGYKVADDGVEIIFKNVDDLPIAKISDDAFHIKIPDTHGGWATQVYNDGAQTILSQVKNNKRVYKIGTLDVSETTGAQYWSPENPLQFKNIADYAEKYGVPLERLVGDNKFVIIGQIQDDAVLITRPAVPYGGSKGGGIEVVCSPSSVKMESFHTLKIE